MAKSRASHSNVIKGPIGEGTPFKLQYNENGTPNYVLSVKNQQEISSQKTHSNPAQASTKTVDKGGEYVSNYVRNLRSKIGNMQQLQKEQDEKLAKQPQHNPSDSVSNTKPVREIEMDKTHFQDHSKPPVKNEPTIER